MDKPNKADGTDLQEQWLQSELRKRRRLLLIFIISVVAVSVVAVAVIAASYSRVSGVTEKKKGSYQYVFYTPDYDENIYENPEYLRHNRFISYYDAQTGIKQVIGDNIDEYEEEVRLLCDLVQAAIDGDAEKYNSFFTDSYFERHNKRERFTMQMIYGTVISKTVSNGETQYSLEYCIYRNNGTFRSDIDSDSSKKQYFVFERQGSELKVKDILVAGTDVFDPKF